MKCELILQPEKPSVRIGPDDDGELRVFDTETLCDCVVRVYEEKEQKWIRDLYMPSQKTQCEVHEAQISEPMRMDTVSFRADADLEIPESLPDPVQVFYASAAAHVDDVMLEEGMLEVEGVLHLAVFYQAAAENGGVCAFGAEVPFQHSLNLGGDPKTRVRCRVLVQSVDASWQGDTESGPMYSASWK